MKRVKYIVLLSAVGSILLLNQNVANAIVKIEPKIHTGIKNDSNFWKADGEEVSVNTYFAKPGILIGVETPKLEAGFDGTVDIYSYDDQDTPADGGNDASDDDYTGASVIANVNYQLTDRINIGVMDELYVTRDPARSDSNSNSVNRDKYTINYLEPSIYYELADKFGLGANYRNTFTDYENDLEDSDEHRGVVDVYYYLNNRQRIYVDYSFWTREYDQDSSDYTSNFVSLNYEHGFSFITLSAGGGYHSRSFDDDALDDLDLFSWKVQAIGMDQDSDRRSTRRYLFAAIGQEMNDDGTGDTYFTASFVNFEGAYKFLDKIEGIVKAGIQNSDYETEDRDEDTYSGSLGLNYSPLEFLTLGLEGGFENRDSNIEGNDYDNTFVMFTLNVDYNLASR